MKITLIGLVAWLGLAASVFAANAEGPVVEISKDGLTLVRDCYNDRVTYKFSDGLKKGRYDKKRLLNYPHLPKQVGLGDTLVITYEKDGPDYVITHIGILKKANGGPIPPKPPDWEPKPFPARAKKPARNEAEPPKKATKTP